MADQDSAPTGPERTVVDLLAALEQSVLDARAARDRKVAGDHRTLLPCWVCGESPSVVIDDRRPTCPDHLHNEQDGRCGDYYGRLDVVCTRWEGHDGLHRTELTKDDDGVLSGVEWGRHVTPYEPVENARG